ncbi:hypothetical protein LTR64_006329 [Lithohypha guttulata]|uniref:uncharacterized protein n=1 Tax=Lithohypha guttulata TaxID=1690604 RepID=UPI002DE09B94|nr:hypothetical protein LTR51_001873 [Lithohypha guttulata]
MSNAELWEELSLQWSNTLKRAQPDLVLKIWSTLESENFPVLSLAKLDSLQITEKLLWPTYSDEVSHQHALLLAVFINYKKNARLLQWSAFTNSTDRFSQLFRRILSLSLDISSTITSRTTCLNFISTCFRSLEQDAIRKECAPLVSIATWENLHSEGFRESQLDQHPQRRKAWRSQKKRFEAADDATKSRLRLERAWLFNMILDFIRRLDVDPATKADSTYCARFLEFLTDLVSQLPTRRYSIVLLSNMNIVSLIHISSLYRRKENSLLRDLTSLFEQFCCFEIDDTGEVQTTRDSARRQALIKLQKVALQHFERKLKVLALSNLASISNSEDLRPLLDPLSDTELEELCTLVDLRTSYPPSATIRTGRALFIESLLSMFAAHFDLHQHIQRLSVLPTEKSLYAERLVQNEVYDGSEPLSLPKLNLQYLTLTDFLWRSFQLQQAEAFYEIRKDMESIVRKMRPQPSRDPLAGTNFAGFSKMAVPIDKPAIIDVLPPNVGETDPAHVRAEVVLDVSRLDDRTRSEWDHLKSRDTVFLLAVKPTEQTDKNSTNGTHLPDRPENHGIQCIRTAEVVQVQDEKGKPIRDQHLTNGHTPRGRTRRLLLDLDSKTFQADNLRVKTGKPDIYKSINVISRRPGRENNFKPMLEAIQSLALADARMPVWLQEVYLGYGQPSQATYPNLDDKVDKIDLLDTFLDQQHLQESFPTGILHHEGNHFPPPPYVLHLDAEALHEPASNPKKRRRRQMEVENEGQTSIKISSYQPANTGPYPVDEPKKNRIRFTSAQIQALIQASQPGLSLIVGPPGTGKTDVVTQLINILYHNFPRERVLLIAHSNQALNQLFKKIIALNIDQRHLLRLGHGEGELDTEESFGKYGRVESFMENRQTLLGEVNRLAASIGASGAHGNSCETADYFNQVFIKPTWHRFWSVANSAQDASTITNAFSFHNYFANAPIPDLFPPTATAEQCREIARGCEHHINRIFTELETIRPFEILRSPRDQANHLLVKEARIVAMTSTHAAIRRSEIASLGFHYDTLIMEEAAQITEIESFIPCAMQNPDTKTGELPLRRMVLVGDHLQNSPIIQNNALGDYANLEQSMFLRLIRLGVPHITLDAQGRCRPTITQLFSWRYPQLHNLPHITSQTEFARANAGFRHEFQFIDVPVYQGHGEREPTPHFIQNLGEAEYAVALFQYMRLLGYPAKSITILAAYAGQCALIRDVLDHRCRNNRLFGLPKVVSTVDKYQGRRAVFADLPGLDVASQKGNAEGRLEIVTGEMFPTQRLVDADAQSTEIYGVEHMGQYVYEMTQAKVKSMGGKIALQNGGEEDMVEEEEQDDVAEADAEIDPLHENV